MKFLTAIFYITILAGISAAQETAISPNVQIINWEWGHYYNPLNGRAVSSITMDDAAARERRTKMRSTQGSSPAPSNIRGGESAGTIEPPSAPDPVTFGPAALDGATRNAFLYQATVKNTGIKRIRGIGWEYVFLNPEDQVVVSVHPFFTSIEISAGKEKKLKAISLIPPTRVISISAVDEPLIERIVIKKIEYSDGSIWQQP
jgi:hypothetical protein